MNPEQLWETTMHPENRVLLQVKIEDMVEAERDLHGSDGGPGRAAPGIYRAECAERFQSGYLDLV